MFLSARLGAVAEYACDLEKEFSVHNPVCEVKGEIEIIPNFFVGNKIDRINVYDNGTYDIMDYKTGSAPSKAQIKSGEKLQLTIAGLIAENKKFSGINDEVLNLLYYIRINGKSNEKIIFTSAEFEEWKQNVLPQLQTLLKLYQDAAKPYTAKRLEEKDYSDYKYLSRQKEF
jgi:ATP-dependent helicase/nuclease subunit B